MVKEKKKRVIKEITIEFSLIPLKLFLNIKYEWIREWIPYHFNHYNINMKIKIGKLNLKLNLGWKEANLIERIISIIFYILLLGIVFYLILK